MEQTSIVFNATDKETAMIAAATAFAIAIGKPGKLRDGETEVEVYAERFNIAYKNINDTLSTYLLETHD